MKLIRDPTDMPEAVRSGAIAIGNFDGVHLGHARIIENLVTMARKVNGPAVVFTFDPHPVRILRPDRCPPPLTWSERKAQLLRELGVDWMIVYPTDEDLLKNSPRQFFEKIVVEMLDARAMVEGPNFYFGKDRTGTIEVLRELTTLCGIQLLVVDPYVLADEPVSSSRVRRLIGEGNVDEACRMLTQPYRIRGMVTHGVGRGAKIGFPTANLDAIDTLLPAQGVYAGRGRIEQQIWPSAINIGPNPTFGEDTSKVEVHLIGCQRQLYGQPLEVDFLARVRDIRIFPSVNALTDQLEKDVQQAREIVKRNSS